MSRRTLVKLGKMRSCGRCHVYDKLASERMYKLNSIIGKRLKWFLKYDKNRDRKDAHDNRHRAPGRGMTTKEYRKLQWLVYVQ